MYDERVETTNMFDKTRRALKKLKRHVEPLPRIPKRRRRKPKYNVQKAPLFIDDITVPSASDYNIKIKRKRK